MAAKHQSHLVALMILFLIIPTTSSSSDLKSSRSALLSLRAAVAGRTLLWNATAGAGNPCFWPGIQCRNDAVVGLRLPGYSLSGVIPAGIFSNLTSLRTLSLRFNQLTGNLPSDLASCSELRTLNLQGNFFNGEIPEFISSLRNLVRLSLASNNFSGTVPISFANLKRLRTLYLENNQLTGFLPELKLKLDLFNISNNRLNGTIPVSLGSMDVTAFEGNKLCGKPLQICPGIAAGTGVLSGEDRKKKKGLSGGAIAGIVVGSIVVFVVILMIIVFVCCKKRSKKNNGIDIDSINKQLGIEIPGEKLSRQGDNGGLGNGYLVSNGKGKPEEEVVVNGGNVSKKLVFFGNGGKVFDLEELLRASAEVLGKGTFGTSYKAVLEIGIVVAVKRLKDVIISEREFKEKIEGVGAMNHENLMPLKAYYYSQDEKLLVYDYMSMGSLSAFLHGNKGAGRTPLSWEMRSGIALGVARGITHLHSQGHDISHGSIKSSNILLTKSYEPRVSDFGLTQLVGPSSTPTRASGYRAPEVTDPRKVSQKADVYSFGVLLLELLTGKAPTHALLNEEGVDLPRWVESVSKDERSSEVFDLELVRYQHAGEDMVRLLELAVECAAQYPDSRPSMIEVTRRIEDLYGSSLRDVDHDPHSESFEDASNGSSQ